MRHCCGAAGRSQPASTMWPSQFLPWRCASRHLIGLKFHALPGTPPGLVLNQEQLTHIHNMHLKVRKLEQLCRHYKQPSSAHELDNDMQITGGQVAQLNMNMAELTAIGKSVCCPGTSVCCRSCQCEINAGPRGNVMPNSSFCSDFVTALVKAPICGCANRCCSCGDSWDAAGPLMQDFASNGRCLCTPCGGDKSRRPCGQDR